MEKAVLRIVGAKAIKVFSHEIEERDIYVKNGTILIFGPYSYWEGIDLQEALNCKKIGALI